MNIRFNLQPWREAHRQAQQKTFIGVTAVIIIAAAAILGLNYYAETNYIEEQNTAKNKLQNEIDTLQNAQQKVESTKKLIEEINKQIASIEVLQNQRGTVLKLLDHLANETPKSVFLNQVQFDGNQLVINGVAENDNGVADFMRTLQTHDLLTTAVLRGIQSANSTGRYVVPQDSEIKSFTVVVNLTK